ncbi:MAG: MlaE family lipid ABC transporter permease subunit [Reyranellaceae bacterium]
MNAAQRLAGDAWCERTHAQGRTMVSVGGRWTVFTLGPLEKQIEALKLDRAGAVDAIDVSALEELDTAGAAELIRLANRVGRKDAAAPIEGAQQTHAQLIDLVVRQKLRPEKKPSVPWVVGQLVLIGTTSVGLLLQARNLLAFFGETLVVMLGIVRSPRRLRFTSVVNLMEEVWLRALPIVGTLVFLIGVVLAYQGIEQLARFGAEAFTVDMVGISVLREIGVLLTAIIVAGRSGSAFTAQIGTMRVNLEVDAMSTMGLHPIEVLVIPRIIALLLTMPLLAFFANIMGLLGGALATSIFLDFTLTQYFDRLREVIDIKHFWAGMIKAPVFAFVIAVVGCYEGLQVTGSAESVGRQTTKAVVESIFLVIILDAAFSILFVSIGL